MSSLDLGILAQRVLAILTDPHRPPPATGDTLLDGALAALAQRRRDEQPLDVAHLGFWEAPPPARHAQCP